MPSRIILPLTTRERRGSLCNECSPKLPPFVDSPEWGQSPRKFPTCRTGSFTYPRVESYIEFVKRLYTSSM
jgi:hypothetical protein